MTTPTVLSVATPTTPGTTGPAKGAAAGSPAGRGTADEFASLIAGLIAGVLGTAGQPGHDAPAGDAAKGTDPAGEGTDATAEGTEATAATATGVPAPGAELAAVAGGPHLPIMGRAPDASTPADASESRPQMPTTPNSGGAAGVSEPVDAPGAPPESPENHGQERSAAAHAANAAWQAAHVGGPSAVAGTTRATHQKPDVAAPAETAAASPTTPAAPLTPPTTPVATAPVATAPVDAPAPAAPAPAATAAQLVAPVVAVHRRGPDGTHTMTVDITPEELGPVRVHVELRDGNVELRLAGHSEAARDALRAALPDLRRALEAAGVGTGAFQISPDSPPSQDRPNQNSAQQHLLQSGGGDAAPRDGGHPRDGHARPAWAGPEGRAPHLSDHAVPARTGPAGSLDLQL